MIRRLAIFICLLVAVFLLLDRAYGAPPNQGIIRDYKINYSVGNSYGSIGTPTLQIKFDKAIDSTYAPEVGAFTAFTVIGTPTRVTDGTWPVGISGAEGYAWKFNGTDSGLNGGDILDPAGDFSLYCVYYVDDATTQQMIVTKDDVTTGGAARGYDLLISTGSVYFYVFNASGYSSVTKTITKGQHITIISFDYVADGTSVLSMYHDNLSVNSISNSIGPVRNSTSDFTIGLRDDVTPYPFTGTISECVFFDGTALTAAQAAEIRNHNAGLLGVSKNAVTVTNATPPSILSSPSGSGTEPFIRNVPVNMDYVGSFYSSIGGLNVPSATSNLLYRGSFETSAGGHPTGWTVTETAGDGTSAVDVDTTTKAHCTTSVKAVTTGTTSDATLLSACVAVDKTKAHAFQVYGKKTSGTSAFGVDIKSYSDASCTENEAVELTQSGVAFTTSWAPYTYQIADTDWEATAAYATVLVHMSYHSAATVYIDGIYLGQNITPAPCYCDTDATCACTATIASISNPLAAGDWQIEATVAANFAWSNTTSRYIVYVPGTSGSNNRVDWYLGSDTVTLDVYDAAGTQKTSTVACDIEANVSANLEAYHRADGRIGTCCNGVCDATEGTAALMATPSATLYIGNNNSVGSDLWISAPVFLRRIR